MCYLIMDTDLQDPPDLINKMIDCYFEGYEVVHTEEQKEMEKIFSKFF